MPALIDEAVPQFCCPFCFTLGRIRFNSSQPACTYDVPHVISSFPLGLIILYHLEGILSTPSIVNFFNLLVSNQATPKGFDGIDFGRAMPENHDVVLTVKKVSALLVITGKNVFQNHRVGSFIYVDNAPHVINSFPVFCIHYNIRKGLCQALSLLTFVVAACAIVPARLLRGGVGGSVAAITVSVVAGGVVGTCGRIEAVNILGAVRRVAIASRTITIHHCCFLLVCPFRCIHYIMGLGFCQAPFLLSIC